jgi:hypothetical protein
MKLTDDVVHELARLAQTDRTVLSAYLTLADGWRAAAAFIEKESSRLLPFLDQEERDYFEGSLSFLSDYIDGKKAAGYAGPGLAFFADLGADFTRGVELVMPPEPLLAVDDEAVIAPLALQLDDYQPVGVITVDAAGAKIYIAAGRVAEKEDALRGNIRPLSKAGGWSQMRYQRHRDKEVKDFAAEVAARAEEIFAAEGASRILLAGRDRMVAAVEEELSAGRPGRRRGRGRGARAADGRGRYGAYREGVLPSGARGARGRGEADEPRRSDGRRREIRPGGGRRAGPGGPRRRVAAL